MLDELDQVADAHGFSQDQVSQSPSSSSDKGVGTESCTNVTFVSLFVLGGKSHKLLPQSLRLPDVAVSPRATHASQSQQLPGEHQQNVFFRTAQKSPALLQASS